MLRLASAVAVLAVASTPLKTPYPPPTAGTGKEPTAGSGRGAGLTFRPRAALATYDSISGSYVLYLTQKPVSCTRAYLAPVPSLTVSIVTVDAQRNKLWHGKLSVPKTTISGKTFVFSGTFAARWCGRV